jgi:hypothetical protein
VLNYNLLSELLLKHKSHSYSSSLLKLLFYIITLINTSNITRIKQTKHIKDKAKIITIAEVSGKALKATITLKAITAFKEAKAITNITYLYIRKNVIFITSQVASQQNTLLKNGNKHITSLVNILLIFIRHL